MRHARRQPPAVDACVYEVTSMMCGLVSGCRTQSSSRTGNASQLLGAAGGGVSSSWQHAVWLCLDVDMQ